MHTWLMLAIWESGKARRQLDLPSKLTLSKLGMVGELQKVGRGTVSRALTSPFECQIGHFWLNLCASGFPQKAMNHDAWIAPD
jgi:hypothetical protein